VQGQKHEYLPPSRGFDHYLGIPYSVDMGPSAWNYYHSIDSSSHPTTALLFSVLQLTRVSDRSQGRRFRCCATLRSWSSRPT